jgi:hypothetical protein
MIIGTATEKVTLVNQIAMDASLHSMDKSDAVQFWFFQYRLLRRT